MRVAVGRSHWGSADGDLRGAARGTDRWLGCQSYVHPLDWMLG